MYITLSKEQLKPFPSPFKWLEAFAYTTLTTIFRAECNIVWNNNK